jgi:hypothetical protein
VAAPGDDIYSTWTNNGYRCVFGTSMASPHVAGLASLIKSKYPELNNVSLERIMTSTAVDLGDPGWDVFYGHGRIDAAAAMHLGATWPMIVDRHPPNNSIDARRPHPSDDSATREGWQLIDVTFRGDISQLGNEDFIVTQEDGISSATVVINVIATGDNRVGLELDDIIDVGAWTTITLELSGSGVRLGFLPGDVDGRDGVTKGDIAALVQSLDGQMERPIWSIDIDRSGEPTAADLIELIDLMNGAGEYEEYLNSNLP